MKRLICAGLSFSVSYLVLALTIIDYSYSTSAEAQGASVIQSVDVKRGVLNWTWTEGADPATELRFKCGPNSGQYTFTRIEPVAPSGTIRLADMLPKNGAWYCAMAGATKFGEGTLSSEIFFDAGAAPSGSGKISVGLK